MTKIKKSAAHLPILKPGCHESPRQCDSLASEFAWVVLLVLGSCWPSVVIASEPLGGLNAYVQAAMKEWEVPGVALAIVNNGKLVTVRGYGSTRPGGDAVTVQTPFPLASVTKNFTATALAVLVEDGKLAWDDPVTKYLPELRFFEDYRTKHTTIRDLLCHRTGLERADLLWLRDDLTAVGVVKHVPFLRPWAGFRERYIYNNLMYCLAGQIVAKVSGGTWEQFVHEHLLIPLEMRSTDAVERLPTKERAILNRRVDGRITPGEYCFAGMSAAAGLQSNAADMSRWLLASLAAEASLLTAATRRHMRAIHTSIPVDRDLGDNRYAARFNGVGLGWSTHEYQGRALSYHTGSTGTVLAVLPEESFGVVVLSNLDWSNFSVMLMYDILDAYFAGSDRTWDTDDWDFFKSHNISPDETRRRDFAAALSKRDQQTKPALPLIRYAGSYSCNLYGDIVVGHRDGELTVQFGNNPAAGAIHWENNTYYVAQPTPKDPTEHWLVKFIVEDRESKALLLEQLSTISYVDELPAFKRVFGD